MLKSDQWWVVRDIASLFGSCSHNEHGSGLLLGPAGTASAREYDYSSVPVIGRVVEYHRKVSCLLRDKGING